MSENIFTFKFENSSTHQIRTLKKEDGSIWFVARDVAGTLGYINTKDAVLRHCKAASILKGREIRPLKSGETPFLEIPSRGLTIIPESDLYRLIMRSRLPAAEQFEDWVVSEVLPQIRKTGAYMPTQPAPHPQVSPAAVTAFLQATTDTFWGIEKALTEYSMLVGHLKKAKKDTSRIIRSIRKAFPESIETVNMLGGMDDMPLEVEMRN